MLRHPGLPARRLLRRPDPTGPATTGLGGLRPRAADAIVATAMLAAYLSAPAELLAQRRVAATSLQASGLREGWLQIGTSDDSGCAFDTPYAFFMHRGSDPSRLLVYFQGGGACQAWPIQHRGYRNVSAVLAWLDEQQLDPGQVIVAGASAGSYGALFYASLIGKLFPSASLILIGDSGLPLLNDYPRILGDWGAAPVLKRLWQSEAALEVQDLTLERAHAAVAASRPDALLTQISSDRDAIQSAFYVISGSPTWREATYQLLDRLSATQPSFRSFVVGGSDHGLLRTDAFYSYQADGVLLREWVQDIVDERPIRSHRCRECGVIEPPGSAEPPDSSDT